MSEYKSNTKAVLAVLMGNAIFGFSFLFSTSVGFPYFNSIG